MGLHPLEFSECYLDSPSFRDKIRAHEAELDKTNRFIKELYKDGKNLINATKQLSMAQRKFAQCLGEFQFEYIGDAKTDDEKFFSVLSIMRNITETLMKPLEKFRKEQLGSAKAERKKYEKETEKYYTSLEKLLNMSAKKKEPQLQEADMTVEGMRHHFQEESLEYVCKLQEIQERKKFECVEPMLAFFQTVFTFYHQGFELAKDFDHYKRALQINIQNTRSRFEGTRSEVVELMKKIKEAPQEYRQTSPISSEGYLYVQEKRPPPFGSSWVKRYCTFVKEQKILHMVTFDPKSGGKLGETESVTLKSCVRKTTDTLDRRFCLDIEITDRPGTVLTVQALSEDDHKFWMQAMGGKEPFNPNDLLTGINDQGLYRVVGVSSKVQKLLSLMIGNVFNLSLSLSLSFYRSLPEPLMTYGLYKEFIVPAKGVSPEARVQAIHCLVHKLPEKNQEVLSLVTKHLANVAAHSKQNLMTVANLGVVFGPTLMRPQEETVAAIMDLKFQNIVVEILIEQHEKIFGDAPSTCPASAISPLAPTRQSKKQSRQSRPLAVYNPQVLDIHTGKKLYTLYYHILSYTSLYSHILSYTTIYYPILPYTILYYPIPPYTPIYYLILPYISFYYHILSYTSLYSHILPYTVLYLPILPYTTIYYPILPYTSLYSHILPYTILYYPIPPYTPIYYPILVTQMKAKAVYSCEAEHDSELSFQVGAIFTDVTPSREPGWLEGELEGRRGLIPENYVEML
uniref:Rho GTPase activating protein 10 n=1 Tax=Astyanax mexicanus TaxID=7994 RepID=A0A3B1JM16_ASTMX